MKNHRDPPAPAAAGGHDPPKTTMHAGSSPGAKAQPTPVHPPAPGPSEPTDGVTKGPWCAHLAQAI